MNVCLDLIHVAFAQLAGNRKIKAQIKARYKCSFMEHQKGGKCESNICGLYIFLYYFNTHIHTQTQLMNKKNNSHIQKYIYKNTISYILLFLLLNSSFMLPQSERMNQKKEEYDFIITKICIVKSLFLLALLSGI